MILSSLADVRIFEDSSCHRAYGFIFDPNTEICAGDYNKKADTMVSKPNRTFDCLSFYYL
jgi:hypothetical protein